MPDLTLYYSETINPRKACAVARYVDAPVDYVLVDLGAGEHRAESFATVNPNHKVPVLVEDGHAVWEANAIMCRLAQITNSPLWPEGRDQTEVIRWLSWDAASFTRFGGELYFHFLIRPFIGLGTPSEEELQGALSGFRRAAAILDKHLEEREWVAGCHVTIADFALGVSLAYADTCHIPVQEFSNVGRWYRNLSTLKG